MTDDAGTNGFEQGGVLQNATGPRASNLDAVRNLAGAVRDEVVERLSTVTREWCDNTIAGVKVDERSAMNRWAAAMRLNGAEQVINVNLATVTAFGMTEAEVRGIIEIHRASSAGGVDECERVGVDLLRFVLQQEPERRAAILAAIGGEGVRQIEANDERPA